MKKKKMRVLFSKVTKCRYLGLEHTTGPIRLTKYKTSMYDESTATLATTALSGMLMTLPCCDWTDQPKLTVRCNQCAYQIKATNRDDNAQ